MSDIKQLNRDISRININTSEILDKVASKSLRNIRKRHGKYPTDSNWQPLKRETVQNKRRGDTPLLESGELRDSYSKAKVSESKIIVSSGLDKAVWMEFGVRTKNIPARPVIHPESIQAENYMESIAQKEIDNTLIKLGL